MSTESPYPRENYHGDLTGGDEQHDPDQSDDNLPTIGELLDRNAVECDGTEWCEYVGRTVLRDFQGAVFLCPECLYEQDRTREQTDPRHHVNKLHKTEHRHIHLHVLRRRWRECTTCGSLSFGGVLADRPKSEFAAVADHIVDVLPVGPNQADKLRSDALARKGRGRMNDEQIIEKLLREYRNSE